MDVNAVAEISVKLVSGCWAKIEMNSVLLNSTITLNAGIIRVE